MAAVSFNPWHKFKALLDARRFRRLTHEVTARVAERRIVQQSYIICATPRSGSTLLCEALTRTNRAGVPTEWMVEGSVAALTAYFPGDMPQFGTKEYLPRIAEHTATANGIFGLKAMWTEFTQLIESDRWGDQILGSNFRGSSYFPNLSYIYIHRRDVLRSAISKFLAEQTGIWNTTLKNAHDSNTIGRRNDIIAKLADPHSRAMVFDRIEQIIADTRSSENSWQQFFDQNGISPCVVEYESMTQDMETTIRNVLAFLHQPQTNLPDYRTSHLQKLSDELNKHIITAWNSR